MVFRGDALVRSISDDHGKTWTKTVIANGVFKEADGVSPMIYGDRDPTMAYDSFGNLFLSYMGKLNGQDVLPLYVSEDDGSTFWRVSSFTATTDRDLPRMAIGPSGLGNSVAVWVSYWTANGSRIRGVKVNGHGRLNIEGTFSDRPIPLGHYSKLTAPSVGPYGQLVISYVDINSDIETYNPWPPTLRTVMDPDGLGPMPFRNSR